MSSSEPPEISEKVRIFPKGYPEHGSFAELLRWHFRNGTRPNGDPSRPGKKRWSPKEFEAKIGLRSLGRTVRYWIRRRDPKRPNDLPSIEQALFGENEKYDRWR